MRRPALAPFAELIKAARAKVPRRYTRGLDAETAAERRAEIRRRVKEGGSYEPLPGDEEAETRPSKYSRTELAEAVRERYDVSDGDSFLNAVSELTGISRRILRQVHRRGAQAWAIGHRPGASQTAWARARVYSFATGGKTQRTTDADLWREHIEERAKT